MDLKKYKNYFFINLFKLLTNLENLKADPPQKFFSFTMSKIILASSIVSKTGLSTKTGIPFSTANFVGKNENQEIFLELRPNHIFPDSSLCRHKKN